MPAKISDSASKKGFISWALSGGIYMKQKGAIFGTSGIAIFFVVIPRWFALGIERRDNTALMISFGFLIFAIFLIYFGYRVYLQDFEKGVQKSPSFDTISRENQINSGLDENDRN